MLIVPETFSFTACFLNFVYPFKESLLMAQFVTDPFQIVYLFSNKKNTIAKTKQDEQP